MRMDYFIDEDSFGEYLPVNWTVIANYLNDVIDERGIAEDFEACSQLWEDYCNGDIKDAPQAEWVWPY